MKTLTVKTWDKFLVTADRWLRGEGSDDPGVRVTDGTRTAHVEIADNPPEGFRGVLYRMVDTPHEA